MLVFSAVSAIFVFDEKCRLGVLGGEKKLCGNLAELEFGVAIGGEIL